MCLEFSRKLVYFWLTHLPTVQHSGVYYGLFSSQTQKLQFLSPKPMKLLVALGSASQPLSCCSVEGIFPERVIQLAGSLPSLLPFSSGAKPHKFSQPWKLSNNFNQMIFIFCLVHLVVLRGKFNAKQARLPLQEAELILIN